MSEVKWREFLSLLAASPLACLSTAQSTIKTGYAAITWGGDDPRAIEDVAAAGFRGIQLRASAFERWSAKPGELKALLASHGLAFPVLSSGNLKYQPPDVAASIDTHVTHAKFVRDAP